MTGDRRRGIEVREDGSMFNHATMRMWLQQMDRNAPKLQTVQRLSKQDPEIMAFEAQARGARANRA